MKKQYYIFSLDMKILNIFSFIIFFFMMILTFIINKNFLIEAINYTFATKNLMLTICLVLGYLILHEIFHSIAYCIYGAKYKNIVYGIELEKGIFYCLCKQNVNKRKNLNSLMYPLFYLGILTYIISFFLNNAYLLILSIFNISGCVGDIFTFLFILKLNKNLEFSEFDDTTSFSIYTEDDLTKKKHFGLKYIGVKDELVRLDHQKIKITKWSYIIIISLLILGIITKIR